jgi:hypothetical protein
MSQLQARAEEFVRNFYVPAIMNAFSDTAHADELDQYVRENLAKGCTKAKESAKGMRLASAIKAATICATDANFRHPSDSHLDRFLLTYRPFTLHFVY